jgi:hypothetical protein
VTAHRRYYFEMPGEWMDGGHEKLADFLHHAAARRWWYNEPIVEGAPFNRMAWSYTVSGRDQWFVHKRAMALAVDAIYVIGRRERDVPQPIWETLGPDGLRWRVPSGSDSGSDQEGATEADEASVTD